MLKKGMTPVHPGAILKEMYLEPLELSVTEFADNIGVARKTVSQIINEHSGISAEMALRLSTAFDTTPEIWLDMQQKYDLWRAAKNVKLTQIKHLTVKTKSLQTTASLGTAAADKLVKGSRSDSVGTRRVAIGRKINKDKVTKP